MAFQTVTTTPMVAPAFYRRAIPSSARVDGWRGSDGWSLRRFHWPAAGTPRGSILFQTGRGDIFEKYLEAFAYWHARGWAVTSLDWRGQGGSGRMCADAHVGHAVDFGTWVSDLAEFWRHWAPDAPGPHVLMGHSMGGHLVLQALIERAIRPDAAVLTAPMLGLRSPVGAKVGERLARWMAGRGPARAAWKGNERPGAASRQSLLTHDAERYEDEVWWRTTHPEIALGPPSWNWLQLGFAATREQQSDRRLAELHVPLLMLVASADKLVDPRAAVAVAGKLPDAELVVFGRESAHEILREADPVRDRALTAIDRFLDARAPA